MNTTRIVKQSDITTRLVAAVSFIWSQIGSDVAPCVEDEEEANVCAIESCLDCDRLNPLKGGINDDIGAWADYELLKRLYGYDATLRALAAHPQLQFV